MQLRVKMRGRYYTVECYRVTHFTILREGDRVLTTDSLTRELCLAEVRDVDPWHIQVERVMPGAGGVHWDISPGDLKRGVYKVEEMR